MHEAPVPLAAFTKAQAISRRNKFLFHKRGDDAADLHWDQVCGAMYGQHVMLIWRLLTLTLLIGPCVLCSTPSSGAPCCTTHSFH